jgi:hypothetical protein
MFIEIKALSSIPTTLFRDGKAKKGERLKDKGCDKRTFTDTVSQSV